MTDTAVQRRLMILSGDDYGLTPGVSEGILRAHEYGVLTSTSVLTNTPAFDQYSTALSSSGIDVGLHICFAGEDPPLLTATEIPTLMAPGGGLNRDWKQFLRQWLRGGIDPEDLAREADAQFDALVAAGVTPSHLDTHQHLHLWPPLASMIIHLAARRQVPAVRVPTSRFPAPTHVGVNALSRRLRRKVANHNLATTDRFAGLHQAGSWNEPRLTGTIERMARLGVESIEIGTHPGLSHDPDRARYRWGYQWSREFDALTSARLNETVARCGFALGGFGDLTARKRNESAEHAGTS